MTPRILVVDDSRTARCALRMMLADRYEVHEAGDGPTCLARVRTVRPQLVLMDVMMPGMDGIAISNALRAHPATRDIPIILVTSMSSEWDVEAGYSSGCADYILKPVDRTELLVKVASCLAGAVDAGAS